MYPSHDTTSTDSRKYAVAGMACGHCVTAVTEEVEQVPGVTAVHVELAGYEVVGS